MAITHLVVLLVSTLLVISESSYVTPLRKCNSKDSDCLKNYFESVVLEASNNGIPEANIPVLDPIDIKNYHTSVPGWVDFNFDGIGYGMKTCKIDKFRLSFEKRYAAIDVTCDLLMDGHYKVYTNSSLIRNLLDGDSIYGEGTGSLKFEKMKMKYDFHFKVEQRGEDHFINSNFDRSKFAVDILRKATFAADSLYLGKSEASGLIITAMNENWKLVMDGTALQFMYKIRDHFFEWTKQYFNAVAIKTFLTDDVTPYVVT